MTMRVMGIRGELTGRCLTVREMGFTMDVDGEDFGADVSWWRVDASRIRPGALLFVVGRISFREFDRDSRQVMVHADRVDLLEPPPSEKRPSSGKLAVPAIEASVEEVATSPPEGAVTPRPSA